MRILHVIPQFPYLGGDTIIGGHASALLTLARAQAAGGAEVTIVSYLEGRTEPVPIGHGAHAVSLFTAARPGTAAYGLRFRHRLRRWARERRDRFDLVHCHSGFADYLLVSGDLQRTVDLPVIHTLYCPIPARGGRCRAPLVRGAIRRRAARLRALAAISGHVAASMSGYGLGPVHRVPPAVDLERFRPTGDACAARRELGLAPDEIAVLFVGNARPQKNLAGVLEAFHRLRGGHPRSRLVMTTELAQSSSDAQLARLRRRVAELDLEPAIIRKGIVENMPRLMQACDVLVAPFLDTFGPSDYFMAVLEAMACGTPAVVSAVGGMPEVISEEVGRLVNPLDPGDIARGLEGYLADGERRRAAGAAARRYTERHFAPDRIAAQYHALYTDTAS